jgi:hypothetical protein
MCASPLRKTYSGWEAFNTCLACYNLPRVYQESCKHWKLLCELGKQELSSYGKQKLIRSIFCACGCGKTVRNTYRKGGQTSQFKEAKFFKYTVSISDTAILDYYEKNGHPSTDDGSKVFFLWSRICFLEKCLSKSVRYIL